MFRGLWFVAIIGMFLIANTTEAAVKCNCPTIDAKGEGNTSCSASESNNECTIDYNLFAEREQRANNLLNNAGVNLLVPNPRANSIDLRNLHGSRRVDAVILYMSVAASAQGSLVSTKLKHIVQRLRNNFSTTINQAFTPVPPSSSKTILVNNSNVVISSGCVEMRVPGLWVMFKAQWSPFRAMPRCGGRNLKP